MIDILVNKVADLYKSEYNQLLQTKEGRSAILSAQSKILYTRDSLEQVFNDDNIIALCCFGDRYFSDGSIKEMAHVILLERMPHDEYLIYDPNDLSKPIQCSVIEKPTGLYLKWKCKYGNETADTTQVCHVVPKNVFFKVVTASVPKSDLSQ